MAEGRDSGYHKINQRYIVFNLSFACDKYSLICSAPYLFFYQIPQTRVFVVFFFVVVSVCCRNQNGILHHFNNLAGSSVLCCVCFAGLFQMSNNQIYDMTNE